MLQFALEPLLAGPPGPGATAGAQLHATCKILRSVRCADDATPEPAGPALALLSDVGLSLARQLAARAGRGGGGAPDDRVPGGVPLPRSLFRVPDPPRDKLVR